MAGLLDRSATPRKGYLAGIFAGFARIAGKFRRCGISCCAFKNYIAGF